MPAPGAQSRLLSTDAAIAALANTYGHVEIIAADTEFNRTSTYRPQLCLIQMASGENDSLVDMLAATDFTVLRELFTAAPGLKLFHAAKQDLEALLLNLGWLPNRILDTQIAAGLLGYPPQAGYGTLVEELLGRQLDKAATRSDWSKRPLTAAQLRYARDDVIYLLQVFDCLRDKLLAANRFDWALEDSAALLDPALYVVAPADAWQRLGGLQRQPAPVQARARALAEWREARAQDVNRPRQWVLADKPLMNIARANPRNLGALGRVAEVPASVVRRQGPPLLEALEKGNAFLAGDSADFAPDTPSAAPNPAALKAMAKLVGDRAHHLGVAPEILATRRELSGLLRGQAEQRVTRGWRRDVIGAELLAAI
jgi:ribonuclease D